MSIAIQQDDLIFTLSGGQVSYVMQVVEGRLMHLYWGRRLPDHALSFRKMEYPDMASFDMRVNEWPWEVPVCGSGRYGTPALKVTTPYGDHVTCLRYGGCRCYAGKKPLPGLPALYVEKDSEADTLEIDLADDLTGLTVTLRYTMYGESGLLCRSMTVRNGGSGALLLEEVRPASVMLWDGDLDVVHLKGAWARERGIVRCSAGGGTYAIGSQRGASSHEENPFIALCRRNTDEMSGEVWGMNFIYSGSFTACAEVNNQDHTFLSMGMNPAVFSWRLEAGECFDSPEAVLVYSDQGFNGMSRIFHEAYRTRLVRGPWRDKARPTLINNWEATYFDFTEEHILEIAAKGHELGIELFVLDDGWFGKRNDDRSSLGDWYVNREKLPHGLSGLSEKIHAMGMMFGIWVEPEMVSPDSDLYRAHPDWCLHVPGRPRTESRQQLILDLSRSEVQDYIIDAVTGVLRESRADYVKWDMNRNMTEYCSAASVPERQKETQHRYMLGLYRVMETIRSAYPEVLFEGCSGGGGRFDGGILYYMPQIWTSDNTDAIARLSIQYGTSMVYPNSAMGAHVSAAPNHQTGRTTPLSTRGAVAAGGNFGYELDITALTEAEQAEIRQQVQLVGELRQLTQRGTFYRLISPEKGQHAAWMFVSPDGGEALLFVCQMLQLTAMPPIRVKLAGLTPGAMYGDEAGNVYAAEALMQVGCPVQLRRDFESRLIRFHRI